MHKSGVNVLDSEYVLKTPSLLKDKGPWDVIIIGSGMGGMACGAALSKYGYKVLVFEQHYMPGGFTHTFSRKGFTWDVGVHCIGEMGPGELPGELLRWLSNDEVQMVKMGSVYETFYFPDGFKITFPDSAHEFRKTLEERFPEEKEGIANYFKLVKEVVRKAPIYFTLKTMPEKLDRLASKTIFRSARQYWEVSTSEVIDALIQNPKLKSVLTGQWGYYGSIPSESSFGIHALTARHFWNGGYYPDTGAASIGVSLINTIGESGGRVCVRCPVEKVLVDRGKAVGVQTSSGEEFYASKVVSAVGAKNTVSIVPEAYQKTNWAQEIQSLGQSPSYICLNLAFEGDILSAGATVSNQWFFESWSTEADEWEVRDPNSIAPIIYLSFPSLKDPHHDAGPNQRNTGEAVTFVPWGAFEKWKNTRRGKRDPEYLQFKKQIEQRFVAQLRRHIPQLMDKVVYHELSTPLSTSFFTRAPQGAIYGLEATPRRFTSPYLRTRTPVKNLYLAGGDVATLGVTGAMVGGVLAAGTICPRVLSHLIEVPRFLRKTPLVRVGDEALPPENA